MKKKTPLLVLLLLLFFTGSKAQDSIVDTTLEKFVLTMEANPIDYETALLRVKEVKVIEMDKKYVGKFEDGIIYLNHRLNNYPATKEVVILHLLAVNMGMKSNPSKLPDLANRNFDISDKTEEVFQRQLNNGYIYEALVYRLKKVSPLQSRLFTNLN